MAFLGRSLRFRLADGRRLSGNMLTNAFAEHFGSYVPTAVIFRFMAFTLTDTFLSSLEEIVEADQRVIPRPSFRAEIEKYLEDPLLR